MIRVQAHARLHFGLLNPGGPVTWPALDGAGALPARRFGGVGLMIDEPGLSLRAEAAEAWSASGPLAQRALEFARRFAATLRPDELRPHFLSIERVSPEHSGFGTGTQLSLAVARALACASGNMDWDAQELARRVGRGLRSAVGIHGFQHGGLIVEAGKVHDEIAPLVACEALPETWRIIIVLPTAEPGLHGAGERLAFDSLRPEASATDALCRLVLLGILPALRAGDCRAFGAAVHEFNARVGDLFAAAQGGRYAGARCNEVVTFLRRLGVAGAGQSSWGPALFAILEDADRAADVAERVRGQFGANVRVWIARAAGPATVMT